MTITNEIMERFLQGQTSVEETVEIMAAIAINPELEEYVVTQRRMAYTNEQMADYGSFIPISSMAADDGQNLCDFQCETYILKAFGKKIEEDTLANNVCASHKFFPTLFTPVTPADNSVPAL